MSKWLFAALGMLIALAGLFLASRAHDTGLYVHGFLLAGFGVALNFWLIGRWERLGVQTPA
ncbi:hypothetical protein [Azospirillum sp. SYSU D00513]|uniref:hypothetical protein n=1 Tax=Azospirillum sp. SYSU D00513 TaxID=2812561 RepID=UPI001A9591C0|nr:hypothetical protein [Azospirillum sp. SYSU D00513]